MIVVKELTYKYRESNQPTLRDVNLTIATGSFTGIAGPAGSGKSTLMHALGGIIPHCFSGDFYGSVVIDEIDTVESDLTCISRLVGSVFQDIDSQVVTSVVEDEMLYGLENFGVAHDQIEDRIDEALSQMGISELRERSMATLSGGQKQKVIIAAIMALRPRILVLDEPTAELDPASSVAMYRLLQELARTFNMTVVVVEKDITLLSEFVDQLVILDEGMVLFDDVPREVLKHSSELQKIGVNCPRATVLMNQLQSAGLIDAPVCINVDEACAALLEAIA